MSRGGGGGWSPGQRDGCIDHKGSGLCGSSLHLFCPRARSHWSCRVQGWNLGPERARAEQPSLRVGEAGCTGPFPTPWTRQEQMCNAKYRPRLCTSPSQMPAGRTQATAPGRWNSCVFSLTPDKHLGSAAFSHLCVLCTCHLVLPGQPTSGLRCVYVAGFLGNHFLILQAGNVRHREDENDGPMIT